MAAGASAAPVAAVCVKQGIVVAGIKRHDSPSEGQENGEPEKAGQGRFHKI
jgi:hypothetical protein